MRVLLTGGTGFVGSWAVPALLRRGHDVRLLVRDGSRGRAALERRGVDPRSVELALGDMRDRTAVARAVAGCDVTIHAAARIGVTTREHEPVFEDNVLGARTVIGEALDAGHDPVVHVSSVAVFVPPKEPVISVDSPLVPARTEYGRSKVHTERALRVLQGQGRPLTIVYPGGVIGPGLTTASARSLVDARRLGWPMVPGGVGLIDVRDLGEALAASAVPGAGPRRLMLGGTFHTWAQFVGLLDEVTGVQARRIPLPRQVLIGTGIVLDALRRAVPIAYPLTRELAEIMTALAPTDDRPALDELGITLRPTRSTLEDTVRWLVAAGHLPPRYAPRLTGA